MSTVTAMLKGLKWDTMQHRRQDLKVTMLFKVIKCLVAIPSQPNLVPWSASTTTKGHKICFLIHTLECIIISNPFFHLPYAFGTSYLIELSQPPV